MDAKGETSLALFPAKFKKSMWMKQGINRSAIAKLKISKLVLNLGTRK